MKNKLKIVPLVLGMWASPSMADVEPWYTYWSLGISQHSYPAELQYWVDVLEAQSNVEKTEISIDMLGIYWPIADNKTIIGGVVSGTADRFEATSLYGSEYVQINQYLYGVSAMRFTGDEPGDGFFIRGDVGIAKIALDSSFYNTVTSESGTGFLVGVGYGIAVSEESRLILSANFTSKKIEGETYSATMFSIGGLW